MTLPVRSDADALPAAEWNVVAALANAFPGVIATTGVADLGASINAALASSDTVFVPPVDYNLSSKVTIPAGKAVVLAKGSTITVVANVDAFEVQEGGTLQGNGARIDTSTVTYTSTAIKIPVTSAPDGSLVVYNKVSYIGHLELKGGRGAGTGNGIYALADDSVNGYIAAYVVDDIHIEGYEYSVRLRVTNALNFVNWCKFTNIFADYYCNLLYLQNDVNAAINLDGNHFDVGGQYRASTFASGVTAQGRYNHYQLTLWDVPGASTALAIDALSRFSYYYVLVAVETSITDAGSSNIKVLPLQTGKVLGTNVFATNDGYLGYGDVRFKRINATVMALRNQADSDYATLHATSIGFPSGGAFTAISGNHVGYLIRALDNADTPATVAQVICGSQQYISLLKRRVDAPNGTGAMNSDADVEFVTTGGVGQTRTLPTAVGNGGRSITVVKVDVGAGAVTVATTGGQTINGAATATLAAQWNFKTFRSDGSNWVVTASG